MEADEDTNEDGPDMVALPVEAAAIPEMDEDERE
jgi:hypothetical protein